MGAEVLLTLVRLLGLGAGGQLKAEDDLDWLCSRLTPSLFVILASVVGVRQYVFTPIQCWVPKEFDKSWEEYAENLCWVEGTYFNSSRPVEEGPPRLLDERREAVLPYYQWVPIVLSLQSMGFYLPHLFWKVAAKPLHAAVQTAAKAARDWDGDGLGDSGRLAQRVAVLSRQVEPLLGRSTTYSQLGKCPSRFSALYLFYKLLYITNCLCQLLLMQGFLGLPSLYFGFSLLLDASSGRNWRLNGHFPRVAWCDFTIRRVGQSHTYSVQCVLPANMLNEKVYIFLWFWCCLLLTALLTNVIVWFARLSYWQRASSARLWLALLGDSCDQAAVSGTLAHFSPDAFLLMNLIALRFGDPFAARLLRDLNSDVIV